MRLPEEVSGYVLAGGMSRRMGRDKAGVELEGRTLLARSAEVLAAVCGEVAAIGPERGGVQGLRWVADRRPGMGPLGGLEAALEDAAERGRRWVLLLPVDVPLLPAALLQALVGRWLLGGRCRVGYPVDASGQVQPAVSLVHVEMLPAIRRELDEGQLRLRWVLEEGARAMGEGALCVERLVWGEGERAVGVEGGSVLPWRPSAAEWARRESWFVNVNTPEEVERVREILRAAGEAERRR